MANPIIHYTFDVDGTNSGTYGSTHNLTIPSTNPTIFGVDNTSKLIGSGCLKIFKALGDNNATTDLYRISPAQWTIPAAGCTFSMWIKVPAYIANGQGILDCKIRGYAFVIVFWGTGNEILVFWNNSSAVERKIPIPAPGTAGNYYDNQYHHFVFTVDSSSTVRVYVDTVLKGTVATTNATTGYLANSVVTTMYIGARANIDPPLFGHVDDFRVYDYPFTQANVNSLNITSISSNLNIRNIYDNATGIPTPTLAEGSNAILQYSDVKMEFFLGTARTTYLPYRLNKSSYYQGGGTWWASYTGAANGFVANVTANTSFPQFPCIGSKISGSTGDEGTVQANWLAFHPAPGAYGNNTLKLSIKITPLNTNTIIGYILYYQDSVNVNSIRIETGQGATRHQYDRIYGQTAANTENWTYIGPYENYGKVFRYIKMLTTPLATNSFLYVNIDDSEDGFGQDAGAIKMELITNDPGFPEWNIITNSNALAKTYVNKFVDLSGGMFIRHGELTVHSDVSMVGNLVMTKPTTTKLIINDLSLNNRLFIGKDVSIAGNVNIGGDASFNIFSGNFADGIIPTNAIINYPSSSSGDITITGKVRTLGDVSFNGTTLQVSNTSNIKINGNLILPDQTIISSYDNNISSGTFAQSNVIFKDSRFDSVFVLGAATVTGTITTASDHRIKENIEELDSSFTLDSLTPVQYDNILSGNHEYGVIAHELQSTYPFLVQGEKDGPEYQQVSYTGLIGVMVNEVKQLKQNLEALKTRI
jgi:hypothetical protein